MRVIVSVQSKRGSSRGLVHYIAHSKVDPEREPEKGRELFNAFGDELSVKSANNSIKADIAPGRASNDELHHLVLSFRPDDYRALGGTEKQRRAALKETTRATMERLERILNADRISWAAAVHCNTENPHVHIAIQKEFLTRDLKTRSMTKILPEALPHFESRDGEKTLTPGLLIEAATEKMDQLITGQRERMPQHDAQQTRHRSESPAHGKTDWETDSDTSQNTKDERDILGQGILAEYELRRIESKVEMLTDHGHKMRFLVSDPVRGKKIRISLQDIRQRRVGSDTNEDASAERQIRAILFKLIGKEDAAKEQIQKDAVDTICKASEIKKLCKKNGWKLPTPSLKKDELDQFQDHYLQASDLRRFSYLEGVRKELERSGEIEPRSDKDIARIAAEKIISEMRTRLHEKSANDFSDRQYYRSVAVGDTRASLAQLDRVENDSGSAVSDFARKVKEAALRLAGRRQDLTAETENDRLRNDILSSLNEQLS
ncbi:MAG: relaxase MobL, partial [Pyrinomonadaceae bacterium]